MDLSENMVETKKIRKREKLSSFLGIICSTTIVFFISILLKPFIQFTHIIIIFVIGFVIGFISFYIFQKIFIKILIGDKYAEKDKTTEENNKK